MDGQINIFDFPECIPEELKPLYDTVECNHSINHLCNRWHGSNEEIAKAKEDLLKGFACTVCCYDCSEASMHGGKCKYECRKVKNG